MLEVENLACHSLTQSQDGTASEVVEVYFLRNFLTEFVVLVNLLCLAECDFRVRVLHLTIGNDGTVTIDFEVTFVGIDDDIEILV